MAILVSEKNFAETCVPPFLDVPCDHWAIEYIRAMKEAGITAGYPDGTFKPNAPLTRAEAAAFIIRALEGELISYSSKPYFADVLPNHWAFKYIQKAKEKKIVKGYPGTNLYYPDKPITREELAKMLVMALVSEKILMPVVSSKCLKGSPFPDVEQDRWSCRYIEILKNLGIITGYPDGTFRPKNFATRAEMAAVIYRIFLS